MTTDGLAPPRMRGNLERKLTMDPMLGKLVRLIVKVPLGFLGTIVDLLEKITGPNGDWWIEQLTIFLRKMDESWTEDVQHKILETISTVIVPATYGVFRAKDHFVVGNGRDGQVMICYLGTLFVPLFLSDDGKIEGAIMIDQTLQYHRLNHASVDGLIIGELGHEQVETSLTELFFLMKKQNHGQVGELLSNGETNLFYIKTQTGVTYAIQVRWEEKRGWQVRANDIADPTGWRPGTRVFSRAPKSLVA